MTQTPFCRVEKLATWESLYECYFTRFSESQKQWIFKGHANSDWYLRTTLERALIGTSGESVYGKDEEREQQLDELYRTISKKGMGDEKRPFADIEKGLLREFKRKCHHYLHGVPADENTLEWLTLMQHYGAPTRLLDFTYSFFVAIYFAIERADGECAVWAVDSTWLTDLNKKLFRRTSDQTDYISITDATSNMGRQEFFRRFLWEFQLARVEVVNTYRINQRQTIQQGVFLCPGDISMPFTDNLHALLKATPDPDRFLKLEIGASPRERLTILQHLHRMNVTTATLFPGLDGFAKSLKTILVFPDTLRPDAG